MNLFSWLKPAAAPAVVTVPPVPPPPVLVTPSSAPLAPSGGLTLSSAYAGLLSKLESIKGGVPGKPGRWTWYFDSVGVPTLGYGHVLHHPDPAIGGILSREKYGAKVGDLANQAMVKYYGSTDISMDQVLALKSRDMQNYADAAALHIRTDTLMREFDMLVDFAYNVGEHSLETSTLLRLHNAGNTPVGSLDPKTLAENSRAKAPIHTISDAFCAWSSAGGVWTLGVFHRRCCEALIYAGSGYDEAYQMAWSFHG